MLPEMIGDIAGRWAGHLTLIQARRFGAHIQQHNSLHIAKILQNIDKGNSKKYMEGVNMIPRTLQ